MLCAVWVMCSHIVNSASIVDPHGSCWHVVISYGVQRLCWTTWRIKNALARCVLNWKAHRSSNALLHQLHWLPNRYRIEFKLAKLAFLARSSSTSSNLSSLLSLDICHLALSTLRILIFSLAFRRTKTVFSSRAFRVAAPTVFNSLPRDIRSTDSISTFCRLLKTFYFGNAFNQD